MPVQLWSDSHATLRVGVTQNMLEQKQRTCKSNGMGLCASCVRMGALFTLSPAP